MNEIISKDGVSIAFDKIGKGPALVLVDGAFCFREYGITPKLVPLISEFFTVYSYDRRGRGESSDREPYSIDNEIEDLKRIIEQTGEVPFICGFSSGAALILNAIDKGIKVKKIALFEPPYVVISPNDTAPPNDAEMKLTNFVKQGKRTHAVKYFMTKVMGMPGIVVFLFKLFGKSLWKKNESVANTLSYDVAIMGNYSVPKKIAASINVPTVVIGGEKSAQNIRNAVEVVAQAIPKSQIRLLKGSHNISMKVLAPCLIDFYNH
jgi:pimeloyl-ACP methyl ester carboxylesterase